MVAYEPYASPRPWMPTSRTLGAVFAGSAMMLGAALLQGGPLLSHGEAQPVAEPVAGRTDTAPALVTENFPGIRNVPVAPIVIPNHAALRTPGTTADWDGSLRDLSAQGAPVRSTPQRQNASPPASPPDDTREDPRESQDGSARPADSPDRGTLGDVLNYIGR